MPASYDDILPAGRTSYAPGEPGLTPEQETDPRAVDDLIADMRSELRPHVPYVKQYLLDGFAPAQHARLLRLDALLRQLWEGLPDV